MRTVIMHFYNEEYLLPWWLNHHKKYFEHGILIDYDSTDSSVSICKDICPTWEIVKTKNSDFDAFAVDREVMEIEKRVNDWRITLNTTEFLIGDHKSLYTTEETRFVIKSYVMTDPVTVVNPQPSYNENLWDQHYHGYHHGRHRPGRLLNKNPVVYNAGRHFTDYNTDKFAILWYGFAPWNEQIKKRKLQIKQKIPEINFRSGFGIQHNIDEKRLEEFYLGAAGHTEDLRDFINKTINIT